MPNTTSTPIRSRASTRACAPVTLMGAVTPAACCGRGAPCWAPPDCCALPGWARLTGCTVLPETVLPDCTGAGRGGAGLGAAAVLAGMSNGEGACALEGTGLLCSVIGWLPCHDGC